MTLNNWNKRLSMDLCAKVSFEHSHSIFNFQILFPCEVVTRQQNPFVAWSGNYLLYLLFCISDLFTIVSSIQSREIQMWHRWELCFCEIFEWFLHNCSFYMLRLYCSCLREGVRMLELSALLDFVVRTTVALSRCTDRTEILPLSLSSVTLRTTPLLLVGRRTDGVSRISLDGSWFCTVPNQHRGVKLVKHANAMARLQHLEKHSHVQFWLMESGKQGKSCMSLFQIWSAKW